MPRHSHIDLDTPLEEICGALASAVQQGKALYMGISSYSASKTRETGALNGKQAYALINLPG
jgi:L-glyceraldehyde 3-phosphate reductase